MDEYEFLPAELVRYYQRVYRNTGRAHIRDMLARANEAARWAKVGAERAGALLGACLGAEQHASYVKNGWFEVTGSLGGRWRIYSSGMSGNVTLLGEQTISYCGYPRPDGERVLPQADVMLAQALHLIADEAHFRSTAIHGWIPRSCGFGGCPMCRYAGHQ